MVDLTVEYTDIRDHMNVTRDGQLQQQKRVTFYLGKFGPFTEYFDAATFTDTELRGRVNALANTLRSAHS